MGALTSIAGLAGSGAAVYGNIRSAQQQRAVNQAQIQVAQEQDNERAGLLAAQQAQADLQRQQALQNAIANTRAQLAAGGILPDDGSGAALQGGLAERAAETQAADAAVTQASLAQRRISLLNAGPTTTALLQSGRTLGYAAQSLLS